MKKKNFDYPLFHLVTITYYYQYILTKFVQVKILSLGIQGIILFVLFFLKMFEYVYIVFSLINYVLTTFTSIQM